MMNMPEQYYDCVWIVQPLHKLYYLKTHLYVRISSIRGLGEYSNPYRSLIIRNRYLYYLFFYLI